MKRIGISLSGGGARGIAHIGILKALDDAGLKLSMITGTSAGAIIGALYCNGYSPDQLMNIVIETKLIKYVRPAFSFSGLLKLGTIEVIFRKYLKTQSFEDLNIPLAVAATNVGKGTTKLFHEGPLIQALLASCAIPVIFKPIEINGETFIDGGILNNLPVEPLFEQCDIIIGSHCNPISENYVHRNMKSLTERTLLMAINVNTSMKKSLCDVFLEPEELKDFGVFDFSKSKSLFEIGYEYANSRIDDIRNLVK